MTRVIITGSRSWFSPTLAYRIVRRLVARYGRENLTIIHGACPTGADKAFDDAAVADSVAIERFPANWDEYGKAAGPMRNKNMIDSNPDMVIACHKNLKWSRGTKDCCRQAIAAGIPVWLIDSEDGEPKRLEELP